MEKTLNPFKTKMIKQATLASIVVSTMISASAHAEELSPLVVTASRIAEDIGSVSADVTVIGEKQIEQSQAQSIAGLLRSQAGLNVSSNGGPGKSTAVFLRGSSSGQTLVLIDGVRVGSATLGFFDWGQISPLNIERIEIVRGPQASLYGADAMGGVIQIFTKKGNGETQTTIEAEYSSLYADQNVSLQTQGSSDSGIQYSFGVENRKTDGFSVASNGTEADAYKLSAVSANLVMPVGKAEIVINVRHQKSNNDVDDQGADNLNYTNETTQDVVSLKGSYVFSETWDSSLQLSQSTDDSVGIDPVTTWNNSDFKTTIQQLTWQNHIDLDAFTFLAGLDVHQDSGVSKSAKYDKSITQQAVFASALWSNGLFDLNTSARHDQNSVSDNKTTYKLGAVHHPSADIKVFANYGTGFKAPSFNDLYFDGGDPTLKPEISQGWDVGVNYEHEGDTATSSLGIVYFDQRFQNLISWNPISPGSWTWVPSNVDNATTQGLELTASIRNAVSFAQLAWTQLDATDDEDGTELARRAKESGSLTIGGDVEALHIEAQVNVVGPRFSKPNESTPLAGYTTTDIRLAYQLNETLKLKARMENIENTKYEEVAGYGVAERRTYFGVSATF
ncbi:MAG: TonB-dependent receptor [Ghiorsea sp.]